MADSDFTREVDEELRREQLKKLWNKYGVVVILVVVAVVGGVGGYEAWDAYTAEQRISGSNKYMAAMSTLEEGNRDEAKALFTALSDESGTIYADFADFKRAELALRDNNIDEALTIWGALSENTNLKPEFRDLANIFIVQHQVGSADPDTLMTRITPLASGNSTFRLMAKELLAALFLEKGEIAEAQRQFEDIRDDGEAPQTMRIRAERLLAQIDKSGS